MDGVVQLIIATIIILSQHAFLVKSVAVLYLAHRCRGRNKNSLDLDSHVSHGRLLYVEYDVNVLLHNLWPLQLSLARKICLQQLLRSRAMRWLWVQHSHQNLLELCVKHELPKQLLKIAERFKVFVKYNFAVIRCCLERLGLRKWTY